MKLIRNIFILLLRLKGASDNISLNLKGVENAKIESARQHFKVISNNEVTYDVVDSYKN